jgi:hypothetical protein
MKPGSAQEVAGEWIAAALKGLLRDQTEWW